MALNQNQLQTLLETIGKKTVVKLPSLVSSATSATPIEGVQNDIANTSTRLASVGVDATSITDKRDPFEKMLNLPDNQNFLFDFFEIISRPQQALFGAIDASQKGEDVGTGAMKGLTGNEDYTGGQLIRQGLNLEDSLAGKDIWKQAFDFQHGAAVNWLGFALDVFADPMDLALLITTSGVGNVAKASLEAGDVAAHTADMLNTGRKVVEAVDTTVDATKVAGVAKDALGTVSNLKTASGAWNKAQDLFLGKDVRFYKPKDADEYIRLLTSRKARGTRFSKTSFQDMSMKPLFQGLKGATKFSDGMVEGGLGALDKNALETYQGIKKSIHGVAKEGGAKVKQAIGSANERFQTVARIFNNTQSDFTKYVDTVAKAQGIAPNEASEMIYNAYEYAKTKIGRNMTQSDFLDFIMGAKIKVVPDNKETLEAILQTFDPDGSLKLKDSIKPVVWGDGVKALQFDDKIWSYDNYRELVTRATKDDMLRALPANQIKAYESALRSKDPALYEQYSIARKEYDLEIEAEAQKKYNALNPAEKGQMSQQYKNRQMSKFRKEIREEDLARGKGPEALLRSKIAKDDIGDYIYTKESRVELVNKLNETDTKAYKDLRDAESAEIKRLTAESFPENKQPVDKVAREKFLKEQRQYAAELDADPRYHQGSDDFLKGKSKSNSLKDWEYTNQSTDSLTTFNTTEELDTVVDKFIADNKSLKNYPDSFKSRIREVAGQQAKVDALSEKIVDGGSSVRLTNAQKKLNELQDALYNDFTVAKKATPVVEAPKPVITPKPEPKPIEQVLAPVKSAKETSDVFNRKFRAYADMSSSGAYLEDKEGLIKSLKEALISANGVTPEQADIFIKSLGDPEDWTALTDATITDIRKVLASGNNYPKELFGIKNASAITNNVDAVSLTNQQKISLIKNRVKELSDSFNSINGGRSVNRAKVSSFIARSKEGLSTILKEELGYTTIVADEVVDMLLESSLSGDILLKKQFDSFNEVIDALMKNKVLGEDFLDFRRYSMSSKDFLLKYPEMKSVFNEKLLEPTGLKKIGQRSSILAKKDLELINDYVMDVEGELVDGVNTEAKSSALYKLITGMTTDSNKVVTQKFVDTVKRVMDLQDYGSKFEGIMGYTTSNSDIVGLRKVMLKIDKEFGTDLASHPMFKGLIDEFISKKAMNITEQIDKVKSVFSEFSKNADGIVNNVEFNDVLNTIGDTLTRNGFSVEEAQTFIKKLKANSPEGMFTLDVSEVEKAIKSTDTPAQIIDNIGKQVSKPVEQVVDKVDNYADELVNTTSKDIEETIKSPDGGGTFERTGPNKGARKTYEDGYQIAFQTRTDKYTPEEINTIVETLKKKYGATEVDLGIYHYNDGTVAKELSLHVPDEASALEIAKTYNQESTLKWIGGGEMDFISNPDYVKPVEQVAEQVVEPVLEGASKVVDDGVDPFMQATPKVEGPKQYAGKIPLGNFYTADQIKTIEDSMKLDWVNEGVAKFDETIKTTQRVIGEFEFGNPNALISKSMEGYATHAVNKDIQTIMEQLKKDKVLAKGSMLDFSYFAPGRTAALSTRAYIGSALEANNVRKAFYKQVMEEDAWLAENLVDVTDEAKESMEEFFNQDLFSQDARASLDAFMSKTYGAINKNHKTQGMLVAMSIGNPDGEKSALRVITSDEGIPSNFEKLTSAQSIKLRNTLLKNQEYAGEDFFTNKLLDALKRGLADGKSVILEKHLYNKLNVFEGVKPKNVLDLMDSFNRMFKLGKTLSPGFNAKNLFGNMTNMMLSGVPVMDTFKYWNRALDLHKQMKEVMDTIISKGTAEGLTDSQQALYKTYREFLDAGFLDKAASYKLMDIPLADMEVGSSWDKKFQKTTYNRAEGSKLPDVFGNPVSVANMQLNLWTDNHSRLALYMYAKEHPEYLSKLGFDPTAPNSAMNAVRFALFDPNDLTFFEDDVMKRVIPFYTFTRQNLIFQAKNITKNSDRYYKVAKAYDAWNSEFAGLSKDDMADYQRNQFYVPIFGKKGGEVTALKTSLPLSALTELSFDAKDMVQQYAAMMSPAIKAPYEFATGTNTLTGQPISNYAGEHSKNIPGLSKEQEWQASQVGIDVPMRGISGLIDMIGKGVQGKDMSSDFNRMSGLTAKVNPEQNAMSKEYDKLTALQDKMKQLKDAGTTVPTLQELSAKLQGNKNDEKLARMKAVLDMVNQIKR